LKVIKLIQIFFLSFICLLSCKNHTSAERFHDFQILHSKETSFEKVKQNKTWKKISSLQFIELFHINPKSFNHGWLKICVTVDDPLKYKGLFLYTQELIDKTYINKTLIGEKNLLNITGFEYFKPSLYLLPADTLKKGNNDLYIRISLMSNIKGSIRYLVLLSDSDYDNKKFWNDLLYEQFFIILIIMFSSLLMFQITMFLVDRKLKIRLINSLFLLYIIVLLVMTFFLRGPISLDDYSFSFFLIYFSVLFQFLMILLQSLYRIYLSHIIKIFISLNIIGAILIILTNGYAFVQLFLFSIIVSAGFFGLGYILYQLNRIKQRKLLSKVIIFAIFLSFLISFWRLFSTLFEFSFQCPDHLSWYLFLVYIFIAILLEAIEAKIQRQRLNKLYYLLKEKESQKTSKKATTTISELSEEKLNSVIAFIEENYNSDLSREGIAASVDLNPSYLSTLFNSYTGKKINDYINGLRVKDAIDLLTTTDNKIIDIAFAVGFESISTFIRAFRTETGQTPTEYRQNN